MKVKAYGTEGKADMCKAIRNWSREAAERASNAGYRV